MYWEPETQSVYIAADEVIMPNSILNLGQCASKSELPPIPDTDALTSYLFSTYSEHPKIGTQYFYMNKRRMLHLLHTPELKYFCFNISKQNGGMRRIYSPEKQNARNTAMGKNKYLKCVATVKLCPCLSAGVFHCRLCGTAQTKAYDSAA